MEGRQLRDRDAIALDLVGVAGITSFFVGLLWLRTSEKLGFDIAGAVAGVLSQLPVTVPAALLVLGATMLELGAGLVLARAARRQPFDSFAEALLAATVAAVLKDAVLLGWLGGFGLFLGPVLLGANLAVIVAAMLPSPVSRHLRPVADLPSPRAAMERVTSWTVAALVLVVWAGPFILQLASPVVPFIDVLPNYVGPVEHLRTFGWFEPLTATQSPIIGPSRTVLGYDGLLGSLATLTDLPGAQAIAGFILPQTLLVAAGAYRLASAIRHGDGPVGAWALLAFALSQPFARLADARGTVVVVPLVCLGLAVAAQLIDDRRPRDTWRIGRGAVIGLGLGSAILVHPVIGFFAVATIAIVALARPRDAAPDVAVAGLTAGLIALPQLATMVGLELPTIALGLSLPIAVVTSVLASRAVQGERARIALVRLAELVRVPLAGVALVGLLVAFPLGLLATAKVPTALGATIELVLESSGLLLVVLVAGVLLGSRGARSPLVWAGVAVGAGAVFITQALPNGLGFLGSALQFEVPKTVHYWLSMVAAAGAASALAFAWTPPDGARLPWLGRVAAAAAFVIVAALPLRFATPTLEPGAIDAYHLGEHRWSETFAIDLHFAEIGFWQGFPDSRTVVDQPRQEILDAIRAEIEAGRLRHDTPVLHLASSFQQWVSTPLGVFDGVFETFLSEDPEVSHQTVGGRLFDVADVAGYLDRAAYPYVVLEPRDLPDGLRAQVLDAGYASIFRNDQGEVFSAAP